MRHPALTVLFASLLLNWSHASHLVAGDAVFSRDGKRIYVIAQVPLKPEGKSYSERDYKPAVEEIDCEAKTIRTILTTEYLRGIACTHENKIFCTTESALHSFDPITGTLTKIRDAAAGTGFWRVAYDPKSKALFVTTDGKTDPLFMLKQSDEWVPVRMRRHPYPSCLVFAANGDLFFAAYGDLWHGEIQNDEGYFSLAAYRYAPLATLETANTTPAEIGVSDIGVAGDAIYVQLARMGGSGDGWLAQLARPRRKRLAGSACRRTKLAFIMFFVGSIGSSPTVGPKNCG
ncbi:MAG: hypothetical protein DME97_15895 [Verrucomicrobia bacterium]|nr:MAG: hypothetical protein DME97_15895 [Verrucomicrobiota bacterium]